MNADQESSWSRTRYQVYGVALIGLVLVAATVAVAAYDKAFTSSIPVTLQAGRAGLQMHPGNRVKIRGVDLGRVETVALNPDGRGVTLGLALDPTLAKQLPANVTTDLDQLTVFGNKTVQLQYPANPVTDRLRPGAVLVARHVSGEVNDTFQELMRVLTEVRPAKLNATLGAFAEALRGNGDSLGATITTADGYLGKLNHDLPALRRDFAVTAGFADVYADAAPDIVTLLRNAGTTSATLVDPRTDLPGLLRAGQRVGSQLDSFFGHNGDPLTDMLSSLRPTTSLLQEYSPALTCFLDGAARSYDGLNTHVFTESGAGFEAKPVPGTSPYRYPDDLPTVGPGPQRGPNCRGLPSVRPDEARKIDYTSGPASLRQPRPDNSPRIPRQPAVVTMFGPDALPPLASMSKSPSGGSR
ncbi:MCE family protein [Pseudonocardia spinosispora]|uniref:MCE family protein n=1 Tax=Pseudonocardia spinosispora TaxID=103441 RepID=UPI000415CBC4|nr:MCE family protein [Pseudonocardia spinosispora]